MPIGFLFLYRMALGGVALLNVSIDVQWLILGDVLLELVKQHFSMLAVAKKYPCIL